MHADLRREDNACGLSLASIDCFTPIVNPWRQPANRAECVSFGGKHPRSDLTIIAFALHTSLRANWHAATGITG